MTKSNMLALVRRAAGHLIALNFGLQLQARSATTRIVSNNEKQWRPPPTMKLFLLGSAGARRDQIDFRRVSNALASSCNLRSCAEPPTAALVADRPQEKITMR